MVTSLTYQPLLPSVPLVTESPTAVGAVLSSLTLSAVASVLSPASLVQRPLKTAPVVSLVWNWSVLHVVGLLTVSLPVVLTVTLEVYQPLVPAVPAVTDSAAVGPVLSILRSSSDAGVLSPASLVQDPFTGTDAP